MGRVSEVLRRNSVSLDHQLRTEVATLDNEFAEMEEEIERLTVQVERLEAKINPLQQEVDRLKDRVKEKSAHDDLDEMAIALLEAIANSDGMMPKRQTVAHFKLSMAKGDYYIDILKERDFIMHSGYTQGSVAYAATSKGRKYLLEKGKL